MVHPSVIDQGDGVFTIDTGYQRKGLVASHLIQQGDRYAFVDVGTSSCLPVIHEVMNEMGVHPEQVDYVMVTHVHLDHAGAAGSLMQSLPNAQLVVHPRGARHMIDPSKLIAGAAAVYGEEVLRNTFGDILPVEADRVIEAGNLSSLNLNGRELLFLDTPGHAKHHYCIFDERSQSFFTGDTFGLSYEPLSVNGKPFVFPTTTPVQFDPDALHESIDTMMQYKPEKMFLTHFGCMREPQSAAEQLHRQIDVFVSIAKNTPSQDSNSCELNLFEALKEFLMDELNAFGCQLSKSEVSNLMDMDLNLNAQGLCCWSGQNN